MKMSAESLLHYSYLVILLAAIIGALGAYGTYYFKIKAEEEDLIKNKPTVEVRTVKQDEKINLYIKNSNDNLTSIAIDYPLWGLVTNITDLNSVTDVLTKKIDVVGVTTGYSQNNIELLLENIKPNSNIEYEIIFNKHDSVPENLGITISDYDKYLSRYKVSYTWEYKGKKYSEIEWRLTENDNLSIKPPTEWKGISITEAPNEGTLEPVAEEDKLPKKSFLKTT